MLVGILGHILVIKTMKIGDKLKFKKFDWVLTRKINHISGVTEWKYRVYRKYFRLGRLYLIPLSNTKLDYTIFDWRWNFLKKKLKENPSHHYNMTYNWCNRPRKKLSPPYPSVQK
jgi:hypothetical protein